MSKNQDKNADTVTEVLIEMASKMGFPSCLKTDVGPAYSGDTFKVFLQQIWDKTQSLQPSANGQMLR